MLLIKEKHIIGTNNGYMKNYDKIKESPFIQHLDVNNLYGWAMLQKLPINNFE